MALTRTDPKVMRQVYSDIWRKRVTATMRSTMFLNRQHEAELQRAGTVIVQQPRIGTNRAPRDQVGNVAFDSFAGAFATIDSDTRVLKFNQEFEFQWQDPLASQRMSVIDEVAFLAEEAGLMTAQALDLDILRYMNRGAKTATGTNLSPPGAQDGGNSLIPTDNDFRYGSDTNYLPLEGVHAGTAQGSNADQDMPLKALKRIQMAMMQNSQIKTGRESNGRPFCVMMPAHWRSITETSQMLNIETMRPEIFAGRDVTPAGYAGTVYDIDVYLINPAKPDGADSGKASFYVDATFGIDGGSNNYDNPLMNRFKPSDRTDQTANDWRNHGVILAGFPIATTFARSEEITKLFSPQELQAADAYKGWQFSHSFRYMRDVLEPRWLYRAEIQCAPTNANDGGK